jgi:uncharacterized membrane protein YtjA (UPF0391 family)
VGNLLHYAIVFLVIALGAALRGFVGVAVVLFVVSEVVGVINRSPALYLRHILSNSER